MAADRLRNAIRRTLQSLQNTGDLSDGELVRMFVAERDEIAFEALVRRHGPMVLRVCQRLLASREDAEEAFQATFLVLVRKASAIGKPDLVGPWLHGVAQRVARKAQARASLKQKRERGGDDLAEVAEASPDGANDWPDLRPVLDEELSRLPDRYRVPMILCYLEGKTNTEAAEQLGWARWTLATRLSRGRDMLRKRLTRRGLALAAAAVGVCLEREATAAQTVSAAAPVLKLSAAGSGSLGGASLATLADGVREASLGRLKVFVVAASVLVTTAGIGTHLALRNVNVLPEIQAENTPPTDEAPPLGLNASLRGRRPFPDDNLWNQEIASAPVDPDSETYIASIGADKPLFGFFGAPLCGVARGIPYVVVSGRQPRVPMQLTKAMPSDEGPYPIPPDAPVEGGIPGVFDRQMIVLDRDHWKLYELLNPQKQGNGWHASCGAVFDLNSNAVRPWGTTSADGAGLPIFPGLVRYDEVMEQKEIRHALRFTVMHTRRAFVAPARHHFASRSRDPKLPPMGMRVRLRADFDVSGFPPSMQVVLRALKKYGMFVASHGNDWALYGAADDRWNNDEVATLGRIKGRDFEVVKMHNVQSREMPPKEER